MLLKSNAERIVEFVYMLAKKQGAEIKDYYVCDGNEVCLDSYSMYFVLQYGLAAKKIRISNHTKQHKDAIDQKLLRSITVGDQTSFKDIERFITNSIEKLKRGALYAAFDYIKNCA